MSIESNDLCVVIANALDNSIEAVKNLKTNDGENHSIQIRLDEKNGNFIFTVINRFDTIRLGADRFPITTKNDLKGHGIGLKSIEKTAQKYKGYMNIEIENKIFTLNVIMKTE